MSHLALNDLLETILDPGSALCWDEPVVARDLMGPGTGGIALALVPADRIVASSNAWLAHLPPEGASAIVFRDTDHAPELARAQGIRAVDLMAARIVDRIVPEPADLGSDGQEWCQELGRVLHDAVVRVVALPQTARLAARHRRFRQLGLA